MGKRLIFTAFFLICLIAAIWQLSAVHTQSPVGWGLLFFSFAWLALLFRRDPRLRTAFTAWFKARPLVSRPESFRRDSVADALESREVRKSVARGLITATPLIAGALYVGQLYVYLRGDTGSLYLVVDHTSFATAAAVVALNLVLSLFIAFGPAAVTLMRDPRYPNGIRRSVLAATITAAGIGSLSLPSVTFISSLLLGIFAWLVGRLPAEAQLPKQVPFADLVGGPKSEDRFLAWYQTQALKVQQSQRKVGVTEESIRKFTNTGSGSYGPILKDWRQRHQKIQNSQLRSWSDLVAHLVSLTLLANLYVVLSSAPSLGPKYQWDASNSTAKVDGYIIRSNDSIVTIDANTRVVEELESASTLENLHRCRPNHGLLTTPMISLAASVVLRPPRATERSSPFGVDCA